MSSPRVFACVAQLHGKCVDGGCQSSHDPAVLAAVPVCRFGAGAYCRFGKSCRYVHGTLCIDCGAVLHPFDDNHADYRHESDCQWAASAPPAPAPPPTSTPAPTAPKSQQSSKGKGRNNGGAQSAVVSEKALKAESKEEGGGPESTSSQAGAKDAECCICFDNVRAQGNIFGILESCFHTFCLPCIRSWRKPSSEQTENAPGSSNLSPLTLRSCPICRQVSLFIVPSHTFPADETEKLRIIENYKNSRGRIACRHFVKSNYRRCPFNDECWYSHLDPSTGQQKKFGVGARVKVDGSHRRRQPRRVHLNSGAPWTAEELMDVINALDFNGGHFRMPPSNPFGFVDHTGIDWTYDDEDEDDEDEYDDDDSDDEDDGREIWMGNYESDPESDDEEDEREEDLDDDRWNPFGDFLGRIGSSSASRDREIGLSPALSAAAPGLSRLLGVGVDSETVRQTMDALSTRLVEAGLSADDEDVVALVDLIETLAAAPEPRRGAGRASSSNAGSGPSSPRSSPISRRPVSPPPLATLQLSDMSPIAPIPVGDRPILIPSGNIYAMGRPAGPSSFASAAAAVGMPPMFTSPLPTPPSVPSSTFSFRAAPLSSSTSGSGRFATTVAPVAAGNNQSEASNSRSDAGFRNVRTTAQTRRASELGDSEPDRYNHHRPPPPNSTEPPPHPYAPIPFEDYFGSPPRTGPRLQGSSPRDVPTLFVNPFSMITMTPLASPPHLPTPSAPPLVLDLGPNPARRTEDGNRRFRRM